MNAPLQVYEDMLRADGWGYREVQWRLVWEDTRYCDGIIPDESAYFLNEAQGKRIQCRTGEQCPHSGQWATLAGGHQQFTYARAGQKCRKRRSLRAVSVRRRLPRQTGVCWIAMTTAAFCRQP